jgi:hypothetical protein
MIGGIVSKDDIFQLGDLGGLALDVFVTDGGLEALVAELALEVFLGGNIGFGKMGLDLALEFVGAGEETLNGLALVVVKLLQIEILLMEGANELLLFLVLIAEGEKGKGDTVVGGLHGGGIGEFGECQVREMNIQLLKLRELGLRYVQIDKNR